MEKFAKEMGELDRLRKNGALSEDLYGRAVQKTRKEILGSTSAAISFQAAAAGSAEAVTRIAEYREHLKETSPDYAKGRAASLGPVQRFDASAGGSAEAKGRQADQQVITNDWLRKMHDAIINQGKKPGTQVAPANFGKGDR